jgi:hypothetical protein
MHVSDVDKSKIMQILYLEIVFTDTFGFPDMGNPNVRHDVLNNNQSPPHLVAVYSEAALVTFR